METRKKLSSYTRVHCIGIGGIGLSALARYCLSHGALVSGSDNGEPTRISQHLMKEGATIFVGHDASHIRSGTDLVIYTIAIAHNNPELLRAKELGITCMSYPEALGLLSQEYITIAVCGTHGKTTTTAMLASAFTALGESPTVIVGSLLTEGGSNYVKGDGKYLIVEACEYKRSFLNLYPTHVLVTNIDNDHLDYYKDIADITSAFQEFASKIPENGYLVTHADVSLQTQGLIVDGDTMDRDSIELTVPGVHNRSNAQLVLSLVKALGLSAEKAREGLQQFSGTWRRMQYMGEYTGAKLYDDYGHHPTEIKATLQAMREKFPESKYKLVVVFQPHLYSRTKLLLDEFATSFTLADTIYILPIYASREKKDESVSSLDLVEKTLNAIYVETLDEVKKEIDKKYHSGSVVLTLGAGDVYKLHELLK